MWYTIRWRVGSRPKITQVLGGSERTYEDTPGVTLKEAQYSHSQNHFSVVGKSLTASFLVIMGLNKIGTPPKDIIEPIKINDEAKDPVASDNTPPITGPMRLEIDWKSRMRPYDDPILSTPKYSANSNGTMRNQAPPPRP